jgi:hypothetical protein
MTYDIYAMFSSGAYKVCESNDSDAGLDMAERVCKEIGVWPSAFASLVRGVHTLNTTLYSLNDMKSHKNDLTTYSN